VWNVDWSGHWVRRLGAVGRGDSGSIAVVIAWANGGIVGVSVGWLWGLIRWDVVIGGVCWWDVVWNIGRSSIDVSVVGGDAVASASIDLGGAGRDVIGTGGNSDVFVLGVGHFMDCVLNSRLGRIVDWLWGWLVDWLLSAGRDGGVDLGLVWVRGSSAGVVFWLFVVFTVTVATSKGRTDNGGGSSKGSEMHFELYYYLKVRSFKEY